MRTHVRLIFDDIFDEIVFSRRGALRLQTYWVPESVVHTEGIGPEVELGVDAGKLLVLTLGINRTLEKQGLVLSVWGSPDGRDWGLKPLLSFPQKYYCGIYSLLLNLAKHPNMRYVRAEWKINRWGKGSARPMFAFYVYAEESGARIGSAVA